MSSPVFADPAVSPGAPHRRGLIARVFSLTLLFICELVVVSIWLDSASLAGSHGFASVIYDWGSWVLRGIVGVSALFATFLWLKHRAAVAQISAELEDVPVAWGLLVWHAIAMAIFGVLSAKLYGASSFGASGVSTGGPDPNLLSAAWFLAGSAGIGFGACAIVPWSAWRKLLATGGFLWIYASSAILLACVAGNYSRKLWQPASSLTFTMVRWMLRPILPGLFANAAQFQLGTAKFHVIIAPECSGLEGAGLILAFGLVWLLLFRHECRFPQSLALVPAGVVVLFLLNAVRIAALILIGDAGAEEIALGGFHSQAGWILFNAVAVGFCLTIRSVPWFTKEFTATSVSPCAPAGGGFAATAIDQPDPAGHVTADNPTAAYLVPFLAILAAGMLATAVSAGFEWLYVLRMTAAAAALWIFRKHYASLDWRVSWTGILSGAAVFLVWVGCDRFFGGSSRAAGTPAALVAASPLLRSAWITLRAAAAIVTVPIAEELAFRGYVLRRFVSADFESVSPRRVTWLALAGSSIIFGLLHGGLWIAGIVAGIVFGLVWKRRGSMGDAVMAHASANALLAAYVLLYGQWHLW